MVGSKSSENKGLGMSNGHKWHVIWETETLTEKTLNYARRSCHQIMMLLWPGWLATERPNSRNIRYGHLAIEKHAEAVGLTQVKQEQVPLPLPLPSPSIMLPAARLTAIWGVVNLAQSRNNFIKQSWRECYTSLYTLPLCTNKLSRRSALPSTVSTTA